MRDEYLTPEEVAAVLKLSKFTVYEMVKRGELPATRLGRGIRIARTDLETYVSGKTNREVWDRRSRNSMSTTADARQSPGFDIFFAGSHDLTIEALSEELRRRGITLMTTFTGSLRGLFEVFSGRSDLAGCHLLDREQNEYNLPFVSRCLPGEEVTVINLVYRWQGFVVPKGNPRMITSWNEFCSGEHRIVNRQKGAGTRVLLDSQMQQLRVPPSSLPGYDRERGNHYATASAVARGEADVTLGIESVARSLGLDFFPLVKERYDLVIPSRLLEEQRFLTLLEVLRDPAFQRTVVAQGGYDVSQMGQEIAKW